MLIITTSKGPIFSIQITLLMAKFVLLLLTMVRVLTYALSIIDPLKFPTHAHPQPYKLSWSNDDGICVKKQALVGFCVGDYMEQLWCDANPMNACSLLGRPWQSDRQVLHSGKTNAYLPSHLTSTCCHTRA